MMMEDGTRMVCPLLLILLYHLGSTAGFGNVHQQPEFCRIPDDLPESWNDALTRCADGTHVDGQDVRQCLLRCVLLEFDMIDSEGDPIVSKVVDSLLPPDEYPSSNGYLASVAQMCLDTAKEMRHLLTNGCKLVNFIPACVMHVLPDECKRAGR